MNSRGLARRIALAVFVALAVSAAVASAATVRLGSVTGVCTAAADQMYPSIHGDTVVWADSRGSAITDDDIYMKNLTSGVESSVSVANGAQQEAVVFGDYVVWKDFRNLSTSGYDIYAKDVRRGFESPVCVAGQTQSAPDIFGDTVVWQDNRNGNFDIYMKDLSTGLESPVCTAAGAQWDPAIWGDVVVWTDDRNSSATDFDIYMKDLSTGIETPVCTDAAQQMGAAIYGDTVVWTDARMFLSFGYGIYMKDLSTGLESPVCTAFWDQQAPAVSGQVVTWTDHRNTPTTGGDIYMRDLVTGGESVVYSAPGEQVSPDVYAHIVTWSDRSGIDDDIYLARLNGPATQYVALEGRTRYETAAAASEDAYRSKVPIDREGYRTVVIATGENFPDALGASSLAGVLDAPVLIAKRDDLPAAVAAEVKRLGAKRAIIVGGSDVVGSGVVTDLQALGVTKIERVAGATRYETANAVARRCTVAKGSPAGTVCFVATGMNFPDALAAAPIAATHGWPIFLVGPKGLSASTLDAMSDIGISEVRILGGTDVVSSGVEAMLRDRFGASDVFRQAGDTRYETAVSVARLAVDRAGMQWDGLAIATGENFPDALCGGALQAREWSVLLLTKRGTLPAIVGSRLSAERDYIARVKYLGGTDVVSSAVRGSVKSRLH